MHTAVNNGQGTAPRAPLAAPRAWRAHKGRRRHREIEGLGGALNRAYDRAAQSPAANMLELEGDQGKQHHQRYIHEIEEQRESRDFVQVILGPCVVTVSRDEIGEVEAEDEEHATVDDRRQ